MLAYRFRPAPGKEPGLKRGHAQSAVERPLQQSCAWRLGRLRGTASSGIDSLASVELANQLQKDELEELLKKKEKELEEQKQAADDGTGTDEAQAFRDHDKQLPLTMLDHMLKHRKHSR